MRVSSKEVTRKDHSKRRHVIALAVIGGGSVLFVYAVAVLAMRSGRREVPSSRTSTETAEALRR